MGTPWTLFDPYLFLFSLVLVAVFGVAAFFLEHMRRIGCKHSLERTASSDDFFEDPNSLKKVPCPSIFDQAEKYISLIIPAFNEEHRLPGAFAETINYLQKRSASDKSFSYEVLIVDDGSSDRTSNVAFDFVRKYKIENVRVLILGRNHGKGEAIRKGMLHSRGELLLMLDADGATKITDLEKLECQICTLAEKVKELNPDDQSFKLSDIEVAAFGSRAHLEKQALATRKWYRNLLMKGFHLVVLLTAGPGIRDTQCGFKMFTRTAARRLFTNMRLKRWCFDVELVYLCKHLSIPMIELATVWKHSFKGGGWRPCIHTSNDALPDSNGYIYVEANGGLNQQRTSICNAVAVAGYLNATLVIPYFHYHSIWRDPSKFNDIYDEDHFVNTLKSEVQVVHQVPEYIMERFGHNLSNVFNFKIKAWSSIQYYKDAVLPKLVEEKFIRISPFANRLSFDAPSTVQRLRCLANFEALQFSNPIATLAENLVSRMKEHSKDNDGKYIAVHLRFEEDMVAFSCCVFDGGEEEKQEMNAARERGWRGKFTKRGRVIRPGTIRINGKCPLTPLEVGLMLRGMGFGNNTAIYLASGKIYKAEKTMVPLLEMFPLLQTKETLASTEELAPFKNYSSRMAAIDYSVCLHSEVFVTTQGGNFPHFLIGHRRYLYGGHSKTIKPDKRKLALLFDNPNIGWKSLKRQLLNMRAHSDAKGMEMKRPSDSLYTFPCPDCMCRLNKTEVSKSSSAR